MTGNIIYMGFVSLCRMKTCRSDLQPGYTQISLLSHTDCALSSAQNRFNQGNIKLLTEM